MAVWMVRAGKTGERENLALEENLAVIGWEAMPNLQGRVQSRDDVLALCQETYPEAKLNTLRNWAAQLWAFYQRIQKGDIITLPLKTQSAIAFGRVVSGYEYRSDLPEDTRHTRRVTWLRKDVPRSALDADLLYSLGAFLTVCQIQRNNAEARIKALLEGKPSLPAPPTSADGDDITSEDAAPLNLEEYARDLIRGRIAAKFKSHEFEFLIESILRAQGYRTVRTLPGADGGIDIVAGQGPMGFDGPRLAVQVKSGDITEGTASIRQLQGAMTNFGAEQGLYVSWGGFKESVQRSERELFFKVRLWDADDVIEALLENYERLPDDIKTALPLKRVWTVVLEEE
jgi:restriction system protein